MKNKKQWRKLILLYSLLLTIGLVLAVGVYSKMKPTQKKGPHTYKAETTKSWQIPQVTSRVEELQIAGVSVTGEGTPAAELQIGIVNSSDHAVVYYEFSASNGNEFSNRGAGDPDTTKVVIDPHSFATFEWSLSSIFEGMPIVLSAAKFSNGDEKGDNETLKMMRKDIEHRRAEKAKKEGRQ